MENFNEAVMKYVKSPTKTAKEIYAANMEKRKAKNKQTRTVQELDFFYETLNFANVEIDSKVLGKIATFEPKTFKLEKDTQNHLHKCMGELCKDQSECVLEAEPKRMPVDSPKPDAVGYSKTICKQDAESFGKE